SDIANVHTTLNTPVLVRSPKLSNVGRGQYLDG
ncbi:jg7534, partial [Pararge aegeria aegeria]